MEGAQLTHHVTKTRQISISILFCGWFGGFICFVLVFFLSFFFLVLFFYFLPLYVYVGNL